MEDKVIEGDFTAKPEAESEVKDKVEISPVNVFLGQLMTWVGQTMKEYQNFPLSDLLNALNTCALAYLVNIPGVDEQKRYLEWIYKSCLSEVERIDKLKENQLKTTEDSVPITK